MTTPQTLASIEHGCFDTSALQEELVKALEDDRKYKRTDAMKKRAIHTAANYDEFRNLVACADLKPVKQKELQSFTKTERSNNLGYKKKTRKEYGASLKFSTQEAATDVPPATAVDFCRQWSRYLKSSDAKYRYLRLTSVEKLGTMFKGDLEADLLAEIAKVLLWSMNSTPDDTNSYNPDNTAAFALDTMAALSTTSRFSLILDFLDNNQIEVMRSLFSEIEKVVAKDETLVSKVHATGASYKV
ncbi:hypothetical protein Poli38472_005843 [Pythium oligandrum]|uniref:Coiled-coil domain-containing protein 103 n=1 Tax=Pythium oligandrum TaxID=41045 RepID=A0A8K1CTG2_PYTOL|nr:hypothetical protein Poli38472_005843 [Pythium oligandrum]|eukprot:TMW68375.1 hypothetical protein Poli38472_005843 [Pythium oligandrum]